MSRQLAKYSETVRSPGSDGQSRMDYVQQLMTSNAAWYGDLNKPWTAIC
jgi:hypothetical protein